MTILAELLRGAAETIRETLPGDEREAGVFVAGLAWAFCLHWVVLITVTLAWYAAQR
jgi:hypothetical protein